MIPSQGPKALQRRCPHPVRQVLEFNPLGVVVGCVSCDATFNMDEDAVERFIDFTHTSPNGRDHDLYILVDPQQITEAP